MPRLVESVDITSADSPEDYIGTSTNIRLSPQKHTQPKKERENSPKNQQNNHNRKDHLTRNRQPPVNRALHITHPIVEPVSNNNAHTDKQRLAAHIFSSFLRLAQLRLVDRYGGRLDTGPDTSDETRDEELGAREGGCLEGCADLFESVYGYSRTQVYTR